MITIEVSIESNIWAFEVLEYGSKILRTFSLCPGGHESGMEVVDPEGNLKLYSRMCGERVPVRMPLGKIQHDIAILTRRQRSVPRKP